MIKLSPAFTSNSIAIDSIFSIDKNDSFLGFLVKVHNKVLETQRKRKRFEQQSASIELNLVDTCLRACGL